MPSHSTSRISRGKVPGRWPLQDAKARFSELVRTAQQEGPQHITVHGRDSVVVLSEEEFSRLTGTRSGKLLVDLLASSPLKDVEIEHARVRGPVRPADLWPAFCSTPTSSPSSSGRVLIARWSGSWPGSRSTGFT